ncbi:GNAT family N-acetyltransferase [Paenibacillus aestuarii]|uniref:GNAT family N-acetyltransferase n=1 Tax=Paenibacillus aestuarii TaxID=516965 RepID=A0ABW0KHN0_9BACL|nr:GNAT family N-acetyltransferase [Paenibacillus aestuarii]
MLAKPITLKRIDSVHDHLEELAELLVRVVEDGASIGYLPPLEQEEARMYWTNVLAPEVILLVASYQSKIVGTVQLHLCTKPNGTHRAEIAKLMTHPQYRQQGIGRALMRKAEELAGQELRSLIVLDTREGDPSNYLYATLGYQEAGRIPDYAKSANGNLDATVIYYKRVGI